MGTDDAPLVGAQLPKEKEDVMRKMLFVIAALLACGSAWADGPFLMWASIVGVQKGVDVEPDGSQIVKPGYVADIGAVGVWNAAVGGRVKLNLTTGFIAIDVEGLSYAEHAGSPSQNVLGAPHNKRMVGTIVCQPNDDQQTQTVNSYPFQIDEGNGHYRGFVDNVAALQSCRDRPDQTVFLLRNVNSIGIPGGNYHAYGIGRAIQSTE